MEAASTYSDLHMLLSVLDNCIKWERSLDNIVSCLSFYTALSTLNNKSMFIFSLIFFHCQGDPQIVRVGSFGVVTVRKHEIELKNMFSCHNSYSLSEM